MFFTLFLKLIPLYFVIALGFVAGRAWKIPPRDVARLVIFVIAPLFFFGRVAETPLHASQVALIVLIILLFLVAGMAALFFARRFFKTSEGNLAAYLVVGANTGYFGVPLFLALYGDQNIGSYMLANIAFVIIEVTIAYYIIARGHFSPRESIKKLLRLPPLYAVVFGIIASLCGVTLPEWSAPLWQNAQGAYVILGMMVIGLALAQLPRFEMDFKVLSFAIAGKVLMFCVTLLIIYADRNFVSFLGPLNRDILTVVTLVPFAINAVAYAAEVGVHPEKAATLVFGSTVLALFYIPLVYSLLQ